MLTSDYMAVDRGNVGRLSYPVEPIYLISNFEQQAMARYHDEHKQDVEKREKTSHTLSREFWKGQLHGSGVGRTPIHATHMRPRCSVIPGGMLSYLQALEPTISWNAGTDSVLTQPRNTIFIW